MLCDYLRHCQCDICVGHYCSPEEFFILLIKVLPVDWFLQLFLKDFEAYFMKEKLINESNFLLKVFLQLGKLSFRYVHDFCKLVLLYCVLVWCSDILVSIICAGVPSHPTRVGSCGAGRPTHTRDITWRWVRPWDQSKYDLISSIGLCFCLWSEFPDWRNVRFCVI